MAGALRHPGDGSGQFNTPHPIAADAAGQVFVVDRGNRRIRVFDWLGNLLRQITIGVPYDPAAMPAIATTRT